MASRVKEGKQEYLGASLKVISNSKWRGAVPGLWWLFRKSSYLIFILTCPATVTSTSPPFQSQSLCWPRRPTHMPEYPAPTPRLHSPSLPRTVLPCALPEASSCCVVLLKNSILFAQKHKYAHTDHMVCCPSLFHFKPVDSQNRQWEREPREKMCLDAPAQWRCSHDNPCTRSGATERFLFGFGFLNS